MVPWKLATCFKQQRLECNICFHKIRILFDHSSVSHLQHARQVLCHIDEAVADQAEKHRQALGGPQSGAIGEVVLFEKIFWFYVGENTISNFTDRVYA